MKVSVRHLATSTITVLCLTLTVSSISHGAGKPKRCDQTLATLEFQSRSFTIQLQPKPNSPSNTVEEVKFIVLKNEFDHFLKIVDSKGKTLDQNKITGLIRQYGDIVSIREFRNDLDHVSFAALTTQGVLFFSVQGTGQIEQYATVRTNRRPDLQKVDVVIHSGPGVKVDHQNANEIIDGTRRIYYSPKYRKVITAKVDLA